MYSSESSYGDDVSSVNDDPPISLGDILSILQYGSEYISPCWYGSPEEHVVAHVYRQICALTPAHNHSTHILGHNCPLSTILECLIRGLVELFSL